MTKNPKKRAKKKSNFLSDFQLADDFLQKGDKKSGRPSICEAIASNGDRVIIRTWARNSRADDDLKEIWRHEIRQLHRLNGYPGAQEYIARIINSGIDDVGFHIALDVGQRRPLEVLLGRARSSTAWLRSLNIGVNRLRLWENFQRVAHGLEIIHNEGLLHRNLDGFSILTTAGDTPDFQLTGFEWSLRLTAGLEDSIKGPAQPQISFATDWAMFALLVARVFNITIERLTSLSIPDHEVHEAASAGEIRLLRDLVQPIENTRVDGELVSERIASVIKTLDAKSGNMDGYYHAAFRLNSNSKISQHIRKLSGRSIELEDIEAQINWIQADLGEEIKFSIVGEQGRHVLFGHGRELTYRLRQYQPFGDDEPTWQLAIAETAELSQEWRKKPIGTFELPDNAVDLFPHSNAQDKLQRIRGRSPSWQRQIDSYANSSENYLSDEMRQHRAFSLIHALDVAHKAANCFPMRILREDQTTSTIDLVYVPSPELEELSEALGLDNPFERLREVLEGEEITDGEGWVFSEAARLGQSVSGDVEIDYESSTIESGSTIFKFRLTGTAPYNFDFGYLTASNAKGDFYQFRRRSRSLRVLKSHTELLRAMYDPRIGIVPSHEILVHDEAYQQFDDAKKKCLKELLDVIPMYLLQGPPGVGKTFLVKDLLRRRFLNDRSERILLTAQGNHPLDHLLDEITDLWNAEEKGAPLIVRCRSKEDKSENSDFDLHSTAIKLSKSVATSKLSEQASPTVKTRLSGSTANKADTRSGEMRFLQGLLVRSANLVFATTNSQDLERLLEERAQFDWIVVEEAAKATGTELITPLMLSHRRLLIGDHKQLPPYGALQIEELLNDASSTRAAIGLLPQLVDRSIRHLLDDDLLELLDGDDAEVEPVIAEAKRVLYLFETMLTDELSRIEKSSFGLPIAGVLDIQHRMDPAISKVVSDTFYGELKTSEKRKNEAKAHGKTITTKSGCKFPDLPLVFINMPYERSTTQQKRVESLPRFTNEQEVKAVVNTLKQLQTCGEPAKKPSLAILTPYAKQVLQLKDAILSDPEALEILDDFRPVARGDEWISTVDAFQGNEADVVIFSLVRNNRHATIRRALGFVGDPRRFNVLLSRAKQKLIFIGSKEFLETVANPIKDNSKEEDKFLGRFLESFQRQVELSNAQQIDVAQMEL